MKVSSLKKISRSELRHRILSMLSHESANSITLLAEKLGVLRPSVSRSVKSLEQAGFIVRQGRTISLSEEGQEELQRLDKELSVQVKRDTELATHVLKQANDTVEYAANSSLLQLAEAVKSSQLLQFGSLVKNAVSQLTIGLTTSPLFQATEAIGNNTALQIANNSAFFAAETILNKSSSFQITQAFEAINATANIQTINLGLLQSWRQEVLSPLSHLVLENNALLGNMMVDLEAFVKIQSAVNQSLGGLINQTAWTTKIFDSYYLDVIGAIKQIPVVGDLELSLAIPTTGIASLVGSTRRFAEAQVLIALPEKGDSLYVARTYTHSESYIALTPKLEVYLKPLGQRFVDKWEGAWQVLTSENKDRHSQATHSGRELLMQVLAYLAPDSVFTKEDCKRNGVDKPSRKMRIKHILGNGYNSKAELVDSMANAVDGMYNVLVGEAHRRDDNSHMDDTIIGMLATLGSVLLMLLSMHHSSKL
jgi:DNA-binding MarR family transcriptional regulator